MSAGSDATLDQLVERGKAKYPNMFLQYMVWDPDEPNVVSLSYAPDATALVERVVNFDIRTAAILNEPKIQEGFIYIMFRLHTDMFAGLGGKLFQGIMGILFVVAAVSGVVVYGPFTRNLDFAFPGTVLSSPHHYAVFMRGKEPLTSRLYTPVLVDAGTGKFTDYLTLPWYLTAFLLSQPLHFGDYGGITLKAIWAGFDIVTILVLASGLYLWMKRQGADRGSFGRAGRNRTHWGGCRMNSPRGFQKIYGVAIWLGGISLVGLVAALVRDGAWDVMSCLALTLPLVVICWRWISR